MSLYSRSRRRIVGCAIVVAALFVFSACGGAGGTGEEGEQEYSFRLAETHPEDHPTAQADMEFADLAREKSDGRIDIEVFTDSQLGEEANAIEQTQAGSIEMTRVSTSPLTEFASDMGVFSLPYIFEDNEHMWRFLEGEGGQELLDQLEDSNYKGLLYYDSGARSFYTADTEVQSVEDMQGLQIRVQLSDINVALMESLGASATPMDFGEVYSALQSGVVDGAENNWPSYLSTSHYEVAPNFTENQHTRVPEVLIMNLDAWEQMAEEDREILQEAATESVEVQRELWSEASEDAEQEVRDAGANVLSADDLDLDEWREAVEPVIEANRDEFGDVLEQIEEEE